MKGVRIFLGLIILLFSMVSFSKGLEKGNPMIVNYAAEDYGAHPQNWDAAQDRRGVMYFANNDGVLEFDGKNWRLIFTGERATIRSLAVDTHGTVYVGALADLGLLAVTADGSPQFVSLLPKLPAQDRKFLEVWKTCAVRDEIYFVTEQKIFRYAHHQFTVFPIATNPFFAFSVHDHLFFYQKGKGLQTIQGDQVHSLIHTEAINHENIGFCFVLPYPHQRLLILGNQGKAFVYDLRLLAGKAPGTVDFVKKDVPPSVLTPLVTEVAEYIRLGNNEAYECAAVNEQLFAIGTRRGGVVLMDDLGRLAGVINKHRGLGDDCVWNVFPDREHNLWAVLNSGLSYVEINSPLTIYDGRNNLEGSVVTAVRYHERIYAGAWNGLHMLPEYALQIKDDRDAFVQIGKPDAELWDFLVIHDQLFFADQAGLHQVVGAQRIKINDTGTCYCLAQSKKFPENIFMGLAEGFRSVQLNFAELGKDGEARVSRFFDFPGIKEPIQWITGDPPGDLWLTSTNRGLIYLRFTDKNVTHYRMFRYDARHGLPAPDRNRAFIVNGRLLIGTSAGLYKPVFARDDDPAKTRFEQDSSLGSYFNKQIVPVFDIIAGRDKIWIRSGDGIGVLTDEKNGKFSWNPISFREIRSYTERSFLEEGNIFWTTSNKGLYRFDASVTKDYQVYYPALIRQVSVGKGRIVFAGNYFIPDYQWAGKFLRTSLDQPAMLAGKLGYQDNSLRFDFSAAFFEHPTELQYRCRLDKFDSDWSQWQKDSYKEYTQIPEGNYLFRVKAKNIFEQESSESLYRFSISPPWQRTLLAYLVYVILFLFVFWGTVRLNSHRLVAAKQKLEKIVIERTAEVVHQRDEISKQKNEIETYAGNLYATNRQLTEAKNALWGEMELAKKIQTVLLPEKPEIPGYEIAAHMKPADEVGGDYYDVINCVGASRSIGTPLQDQLPLHWIAIGDVSGHGVPAGLVMMMAQTSIRSVLKIYSSQPPREILQAVNSVIYDNIRKLGEDKYMTITLMSVQETGLIYFSGLHQDIMIYRAEQKGVELVETNGMWIGIMETDADMFQVDQINLQPGDAMLLYTDGVTEATDSTGKMFSAEKLTHIFSKLGAASPEEIKNGILRALEGHTCNDDVTLMILKRKHG